MDGYEVNTYGDAWVAIYDDPSIPYPKSSDIVEFLCDLSPNGPSVELGVGTGRGAVPLARDGRRVVGIDSSDAMLTAARVKMGDDPSLELIQADTVDEKFALAFAVGFSFLQLGSAARQRASLDSISRHLTPNGVVVIDSFTPDVSRFRRGQDFIVSRMSSERVICYATIHASEQQRLTSQAIEFVNGGVRLFPNEIRYVTPSELIEMAKDAGLRTVGIWSGWKRQPLRESAGPWVAAFRSPAD